MIELKKDALVFTFPEVHEDAVLRIDFQRTLRIPDDDSDYPLPPVYAADREALEGAEALKRLESVVVGHRWMDERLLAVAASLDEVIGDFRHPPDFGVPT